MALANMMGGRRPSSGRVFQTSQAADVTAVTVALPRWVRPAGKRFAKFPLVHSLFSCLIAPGRWLGSGILMRGVLHYGEQCFWIVVERFSGDGSHRNPLRRVR